jgi:hypothetical protein
MVDLADPTTDLYPTRVVVVCDDCKVEHPQDYLVSDDEKLVAVRLEARAQAEADGWLIMTDHLDMCPKCSFC